MKIMVILCMVATAMMSLEVWYWVHEADRIQVRIEQLEKRIGRLED